VVVIPLKLVCLACFEILGSATLNSPPLGRTIFKEVKQLRLHTPGKNAVERDAQITQDFLTFLKNKRNDQPYFFGRQQ